MKAEISTRTELRLELKMSVPEARVLKDMMAAGRAVRVDPELELRIRNTIYEALDTQVAHGIDAAFDKE